MSTGYQNPSRFSEAEKPHAFVGDAGGGCSLPGCGYSYNHVIHRVLTHNPEADEAERLRVRETFVLKDHMAGVRDWVQEAHRTPGMDNTAPAPAVTVTLEQAIIIAKHYLLFDELEKRAAEAEVRATSAEKRAVTAEAFAASALRELSELKAKAQETRNV